MASDHLRTAMRLCTEVGLQTYGRLPHQMDLTDQGQKLQMAEAHVRRIRDLIDTHIRTAKEAPCSPAQTA